jgi:para-nitrobenzyl esterase
MVVVSTPFGALRGTQVDGAVCFLGIPYARPPIGEHRLRSPQELPTWSGVRPATELAPAAPQRLAGMQTWLNDPIQRYDEDCLYLNVWAPQNASACPVLVWFHGGATRSGHGGAAAISGEYLAKRHRLMIVTVNYRLGPLGGLCHPKLTDETTSTCTNWGMQDKIAALRWVKRCASAFGGDPDNVTIAGQSSGGTNAILIAQNPDCRGLFSRVIAQSPPLFRPPMFAELRDGAEYTEAIAEKLSTTVEGLRDLDGKTLVERELEFLLDSDFSHRFGRPRTAPIRDGKLVRDWPYDGRIADVPLLLGWTRDEAKFWYDLRLPDGKALTSMKAPDTDEKLQTEVARLIKLYYAFPHAPQPEQVIDAYRGQARRMPAEVWFDIYTDVLFRAPIVDYAARHADRGQSAFLYEFSWPLAPAGGTPHAADVPFVFGTVSHPYLAEKIGADAQASAVSEQMMGLWANFIHTGSPGGGSELWQPFSGQRRSIMTFGEQRQLGRYGTMGRQDLLRVWPAFARSLQLAVCEEE